jgi:hypothetical protein
MNNVYIGQTDLTIKIRTNKNLSNITSAKILYKNPSNVTGEFIATVIKPLSGIIQYVVTDETDFNIVGVWTLWAEIIDENNLVSIGEPSTINVLAQGTIL